MVALNWRWSAWRKVVVSGCVLTVIIFIFGVVPWNGGFDIDNFFVEFMLVFGFEACFSVFGVYEGDETESSVAGCLLIKHEIDVFEFSELAEMRKKWKNIDCEKSTFLQFFTYFFIFSVLFQIILSALHRQTSNEKFIRFNDCLVIWSIGSWNGWTNISCLFICSGFTSDWLGFGWSSVFLGLKVNNNISEKWRKKKK